MVGEEEISFKSVNELVSISSPSSEGGGKNYYSRVTPLPFPLVLLQAKVVGNNVFLVKTQEKLFPLVLLQAKVVGK